MSISRKEVEHIARLARIELAEEEKAKMAGELSLILAFVEQLREVPTDDVLPMSGGSMLENVFRSDNVGEANIATTGLLESVPETENGFVKVKAIFT